MLQHILSRLFFSYVALWKFIWLDLEFPKELAPVSFACLSVHMLVTAETPQLTWFEVLHFWSHAVGSSLVAKTSVEDSYQFRLLLLVLLGFWPLCYLLLRRLRQLLGHSSRCSILPNIAEGTGNIGFLLLFFSMYLACQSATCLVYGGETEMGEHEDMWSLCRANNESIRHMNYCLSNLFIVYSLLKHLSGTSAQQVMLFRMRIHQGFAVIFSFIYSMYCLYEYSSEPGGMPFAGYDAGVKSLPGILLWLFFLSPVFLLTWWTPEIYIPIVLDSNAIGDCLGLEGTFDVSPDGVNDDVIEELIWVHSANDSESVMSQLYLPQVCHSDSSLQQQPTFSKAEDYVHPILQYYKKYHKIPPLDIFFTYLSEIVFFWRFSLFVLTAGYKLLVFVSSYSTGYKYWAQILNPLSTSALIVHWMLALRCNYRDRVSNQTLNFHFWFHALSEIPNVIVWIQVRNVPKAVFNILVIIVMWPLVFIGCKRIIYTLQSRSVYFLLSTSKQFFIEGVGLMVVQFYLAFQAHSCVLFASRRDLGLSHCTALLRANLWSGMNIAMTFLVVRVLIFKLGGLSLSKLLHLQLRSYEIVVLSLCALSGSVSLYFFANKDATTGVLVSPSAILEGIETASMVGYISVFLLMAYKHWEEPVEAGSSSYAAVDTVEESLHNSRQTYAADEEEEEKAAVSSRHEISKQQENSKWQHYPDVNSDVLHVRQNLHKKDRAALSQNTSKVRCPISHGNSTIHCHSPVTMQQRCFKSERDLRANRCACWTNFSLLMDHRNSGSNVPVFRLILCSGTVLYIILMAGTAVGWVDRDYATSMAGISLACVCCHWLITVDQSTTPIEVVHLLGHAFAEFISTFLWVYADKRLEAIYSTLSFLAVYPCLYHGVHALKLGLRRKFDQETLLELAIAIARRSFILLLALLYLFFESFGCIHMKSADDCQAVLYANEQMGLSAALAFLVYLSLVVVQGVDTRRVLCMELSRAQLSVLVASSLAVVLCTFSLASRHSHQRRSDRVDYVVEIVTLICWYVALIILWVRRPWYDINAIMSDADEDLEDQLSMVPIPV